MGQKRQCNSNNLLFKTIEILKKKNHHKIPEKSIIHATILLKTDKLKPNWSVHHCPTGQAHLNSPTTFFFFGLEAGLWEATGCGARKRKRKKNTF